MANKLVSVKHFTLLSMVAALLGVSAGLLTTAFIKALEFIQEFVWTDLPNVLGGASSWYMVLATLMGGLLVGLCSKYFGDYPLSLEVALDTYKKTRRFDYKHLPGAMVASLASLGFGASLGPEAALIAIVGGLGTWIGDILKRFTKLGETAFISISATVGVLFGSPLGAVALSASSSPKEKRSKFWVYIPATIAATAAFLIFKHFSGGGFFDFEYLPYSFLPSDLFPIVFVGVFASCFGLVFVALDKRLENITNKAKLSPLTKGIIGGLLLGVLGVLTSYALFSGHKAIQEIIYDYTSITAVGLIGIAFIKLVATSGLLAFGWKGGRFFPLMFAGSAFGLGISQLVGSIDPMIGLAVGMSAALTAVLQKPLAALLLLMFFFPVNMYVLIICGVLTSIVVFKQLAKIKKSSYT